MTRSTSEGARSSLRRRFVIPTEAEGPAFPPHLNHKTLESSSNSFRHTHVAPAHLYRLIKPKHP